MVNTIVQGKASLCLIWSDEVKLGQIYWLQIQRYD